MPHDDAPGDDGRRLPFVAAMALGAGAAGVDLVTRWGELGPVPLAARALVVAGLATAGVGALRGRLRTSHAERLAWAAGVTYVATDLAGQLATAQGAAAEATGMRVLLWHGIMTTITHLVFRAATARWLVAGLTVAAYAGFGVALSGYADPSTGFDGLVVPLFMIAAAEGSVARARSLAATATRAQAEAELARVDQLTGLPNRRGVLPLLRAAQVGDAVVLVDVDHFKRVNDAHGHDVGDAVLRRIARLLATGARAADTVGRWGGEEFVLVTGRREGEPAPSSDDVLRLGERLCAAVRADAAEPTVTVSAGVAVLQPGDEGWEGALRRADACLYAAKAAGRDRVVASPDEPGRPAHA